jgi:hypothetical protein
MLHKPFLLNSDSQLAEKNAALRPHPKLLCFRPQTGKAAAQLQNTALLSLRERPAGRLQALLPYYTVFLKKKQKNYPALFSHLPPAHGKSVRSHDPARMAAREESDCAARIPVTGPRKEF